MSVKTMLTTLLTPKSINIYRRLGIRYITRNRVKFIKQSFELLNEDVTNEILSFFKYKHITDDTLNSYLYIFIYEIFYVSILTRMSPSQTNKIIEKSLIHLLLYIVFKENIFPLLSDHID